MRVDIVTIFPEMFKDVFDSGIIRRAQQNALVDIVVHDLRNWTNDKHRTTDDTPYGGGPGMVMKVEPLAVAVEAIRAEANCPDAPVVLLSPRGSHFNQACAGRLASHEHLVLVAGRYEGVDERFTEISGAQEISIGDYVLSGGEIPAMVVVDAIVRLRPGAISDPRSAVEDSFSDGLLDYPHFTRPREFRGRAVPPVLLSGDHQAVDVWRRRESLRVTLSRRPELILSHRGLSEDDKDFISQLETDR